jgi:hypothetical protein
VVARPLTVLSAIGLTSMALAGSIMAVWLVIAFKPDGPVDPVNLALAFCVGPLLATYLGLRRHAPDRSTSDALGFTWPRVSVAALAVVAALALVLVVRAAKVWILPHVAVWAPPPAPSGDDDGLSISDPTRFGYVVVVAAEMLVLVELVILQQGLILRGLARHRPRLAPVVVVGLSLGAYAFLPRDEPWATFLLEGTLLSMGLTYVAVATSSTVATLAFDAAYLGAYIALDFEAVRLPGLSGDLSAGHVSPVVFAAAAVSLVLACVLLQTAKRKPVSVGTGKGSGSGTGPG